MDGSPTHRRRWRGRAGATALSAGLHGALLLVLLLGWRTTAPPAPAAEIPVSLAPVPLPPAPKSPAPGPPADSKPAAAQATAAKSTPPPPAAIVARRSPAPPIPASPPAARIASPKPRPNLDQLVDAQLAAAEARGAAGGEGAGSGRGGGGSGQGGGGECDMAARVQAALRKDPLARAAMHAAGGRSILIWNGDWVQSGAEDGKGLAAVREAITWEVAFAPAACRHQRVRGPVLLSLNDGSPQVELVAGEWRWSDLLGLR